MANNLFIAYDLNKDVLANTMDETSADYQKVIKAIVGLGEATKLQYSLFFVNTSRSCNEAANIVLGAMDKDDSLVVIDITSSEIVAKNINKRISQSPPGASVKILEKHLGSSFTLVR